MAAHQQLLTVTAKGTYKRKREEADKIRAKKVGERGPDENKQKL
jgi:hypothetical protein